MGTDWEVDSTPGQDRPLPYTWVPGVAAGPQAWHICTEAAPTRHLSAKLQWQQNSGELPGLWLQALEDSSKWTLPPSWLHL